MHETIDDNINKPNNQKSDIGEDKIISKKENDEQTPKVIESLKERGELYRCKNSHDLKQYYLFFEKHDSLEIASELRRYDILNSIEVILDSAETIINSYNNQKFELWCGKKLLFGIGGLMTELDHQVSAKIVKTLQEDDVIRFIGLYEKIEEFIANNNIEKLNPKEIRDFCDFIVSSIREIDFKESSSTVYLRACDALGLDRVDGIKNKIIGIFKGYEQYIKSKDFPHKLEINEFLNNASGDFKTFFNEARRVHNLLNESCNSGDDDCDEWFVQITNSLGRILANKDVLQLAKD